MGVKIRSKRKKNMVWKPYSKCPLSVDSFSCPIPTHSLSFVPTKDYLSTWSWYNYCRSLSATVHVTHHSFGNITVQVSVLFWADTSGFQFSFTPKNSCFSMAVKYAVYNVLKKWKKKKLNYWLMWKYSSFTQWKMRNQKFIFKSFLLRFLPESSP